MIPSNKFVALSEACAANGVTLKLALLPKLTSSSQSGMLVRSSQMVSMAKSSKNKEAAAMLIDYLVNNISANEILNGERGVPANAKVLSALAAKSDEVTGYQEYNQCGACCTGRGQGNDPDLFRAVLRGRFLHGGRCCGSLL